MLTSLSLSLALGLSSSRKEGSLFSKLEKKQTDHYLQRQNENYLTKANTAERSKVI